MTRSTIRFAFAAPVFLFGFAAPLQAQDVQYETVTKVNLPGALGTAMRVAARLGGGSTEVVETTYIKGRRMRSDAEKSSTIVDLDDGRVTLLDHEARTYMSFTFDEMAARAREGAQQLADQRTVSEGGDAHHVNFRFDVQSTNDRERVSGYDARRFFLTMQMDGEYTPEGAAEREQGGTLVLLTDMWTSTSTPAYQALQQFQDASAHHYAEASSAMLQALAAAFTDEPDMRVAFEQSVSEASKLEGLPLRTVTHFVVVAPEHAFDRELAIDPQSRQRPGVAQQAGRAALGRVAGRLGGRQQQQEAPEEEEPTQATIMTVTSEVRNISTRSLDESVFAIPAGYTRVEVEY
jgi:hypothetical protein